MTSSKNNLAFYVDTITQIIHDITGEATEKVKERMVEELQRTGTNVSNDFYNLGLKPFVLNSNQEQIYKSDSFIYELAVYNISEVKSGIQNHVAEFLKDKKDKSILMYGDGIGMDSLLLLKEGFNITYYDYKGYTYEFAERLWKMFDVRPNVIFAPEEINENFDIIIAFDVLEHVEEPHETINLFKNLLNPFGYVIFTAPFDALSYHLPTHLYRNYEKYHGRITHYFNRNNMYLNQNTTDNLLVYIFQKDKKTFNSRILKLLFKQFLKLLKKSLMKIKISYNKPPISKVLNLFSMVNDNS